MAGKFGEVTSSVSASDNRCANRLFLGCAISAISLIAGIGIDSRVAIVAGSLTIELELVLDELLLPPRKPGLNPAKGSESKVDRFGDLFGALRVGTVLSSIIVSILMTGVGNMLPPIRVTGASEGSSGMEESNETDFLRGADDLRIDFGAVALTEGLRVGRGMEAFPLALGEDGVGGIALIEGGEL